jgi:hypothetical protein
MAGEIIGLMIVPVLMMFTLIASTFGGSSERRVHPRNNRH